MSLRHVNNLKEFDKSLLKKEFNKLKKDVDRIQTKWYTKWVAWLWQEKTISCNVSCTKENGLWKLNRIYISTFK